MKYYIIAGEPSGDLHGSRLIRELRQLDPAAQIRCWGGDLMAEAGGELVRHYRDLAFMGFAEVIRHLGKILAHFRFAKRDIRKFHPDAVIFIDYPGFNLRMAKWAHQKGFRTIYYISPQVWAWKQKRVHTIQQYVDRMLVILPFEAAFYRQYGYEVEYVGHPLVQIVREARGHARPMFDTSRPVIALLPGSRLQEVKRLLPEMLKVTRHFPQCQFIVAQAPSMPDLSRWYHPDQYPNVMLAKGVTYDLLAQASAALVTSGTATLETALFGVPEVVCYKSTWISYWLARHLIRVPYISLVNLIMEKKVVEECIQQQVNEQNLTRLLDKLLHDETCISRIKADYAELWNKLDTGNAARQAAEAIFQFIKNASRAAPAAQSRPPETAG
ncbi:MAG: lipid-A-disaccharide synthase [Thermoflavifilum aggregans]|nr:lipid-A-disaccharide synthase [Thermoflavifilum aggregans]